MGSQGKSSGNKDQASSSTYPPLTKVSMSTSDSRAIDSQSLSAGSSNSKENYETAGNTAERPIQKRLTKDTYMKDLENADMSSFGKIKVKTLTQHKSLEKIEENSVEEGEKSPPNSGKMSSQSAESGESRTSQSAESSLNIDSTSKSHLGKEITDAVAAALDNNSLKEVSLLSMEKAQENDLKRSPLTCKSSSSTSEINLPLKSPSPENTKNPNTLREVTSALASIQHHHTGQSPVSQKRGKKTNPSQQYKYSMETLRSHKQKVMQETLNSLKTKPSAQSVSSVPNKSSEVSEKDLKTLSKKQIAFAVDETVCGLVIGKGGVNVKKLEKALDVEIIVNAKKSETATKRIVTIIGASDEGIERARQALDYQQVFIPILGYHQKQLVASASQDKFTRWRGESGCVRIEFENDLEDYEPQIHSQAHGNPAVFVGSGLAGGRLSNRDLIRKKKEESNDLHTGFLRLVGTKESVARGQRMIENELDRANKMAVLDNQNGQALAYKPDLKVHNMETNYSRVTGQGRHRYNIGPDGRGGNRPRAMHASFNDVSGPKTAPFKPVAGNSVIYQLWQQQQRQVSQLQHPRAQFNPQGQYYGTNPNLYAQPYNRNGQQQMPRRPTMRGGRKGGFPGNGAPMYNRQKNLDDMLLEGKMTVDEYAVKLSKQVKR